MKEDTAGLGGRWDVARSEEEFWNLGDQNTEKRKCPFCGKDDPGVTLWVGLGVSFPFPTVSVYTPAPDLIQVFSLDAESR